MGDRPARRLSRNSLGEIVEARYEEILMHVREELRRSGFEERVTAGVVLTGGCALMDGAVELAEEILHMPVRLGVPQRVSGMKDVARNPMHATGVGLLLFGQGGVRAPAGKRQPASGASTWERMKSWFQGNF